MTKNVYIRKPSAITAVQFDPHDETTFPPELMAWEPELDPEDGSWGCIQTRAAVYSVFALDWICRDSTGGVWVVEKRIFDDLYMVSMA